MLLKYCVPCKVTGKDLGGTMNIVDIVPAMLF
jgi:hypothetical protein